MGNIACSRVEARARKRVFLANQLVFSLVLLCLGLPLVLRTEGAADDGVRRRAVSEKVHRYRAASMAVRKVADLLDSRARSQAAETEVLRVAQLVLDLETDSFADELASVRLSVEARLSGAAEDVQRKYDSLTNAEASRTLAAADANPSGAMFRRVCRRFFRTPSGYVAAERLVALWLDAGEYGLAARLAGEVLAEPAHHLRITPQFRRVAASLNQIRADDPSEVSTVGEVASVEFHRRFLKHRSSLVPLESGWMLLGGSASRSRIMGGSAPVPAPSWKADFFPDQSSRVVNDFLKDWEGSRKEVDQPCCPAAYPIVVGGDVIFRDSTGLRSVGAMQGKTNWSYRCNYNPIQSSGSRADRFGRRRLLSGMEIPVSPNAFGENSLMGAITSDGQLVFAIDSTSGPDPGGFQRQFANRLVALHAKASETERVAWIHEGQLSDRFRKPAGPTQFTFLGPPLPGATELLCLTEHDVEVHLTAFEPRSGAMIWSQPLCTIERLDQFDLERHETACLPARADGIVVCPTNTGLLIAFDQARMNLLWAAFVDEPPDPRRLQTRNNVRSAAFGYAGYASPVMISKGRVIYLPPRSGHLHCLDLATGRIMWSVARGDAEFVGAVSNGQVLVVGRQSCRSLALDDGREVWTVATGSPAGRGIAIGNRYALPLDGGRFASLDLTTGRDHGTKALRSDIALGHLVADRECVYSLSQRGLAAFPQVDHVLASVESAEPNKREHDREILLAEVAMVQGNLSEAERRLRAVLAGDLSGSARDRARRDLKELLFERIASGSNIARGDHESLDRLLETPAEEFRYLIAASSSRDNSPDSSLVERLSERAYGLASKGAILSVPGDDEWLISPAVWCRLQLNKPVADGFAHHLQRMRRDRMPRLQGQESQEEIERYVRVFDAESSVASPRSHLASQFAAAGAVHSAETLWLRNKGNGAPEEAAEATMRLMGLWEKTGFVTEAARQLELLATDFAETPLPGGLTGAQFVSRLEADRPAKIAWHQSREPSWPVNHVEIHQTTVQPEFVQQILPSGSSNREPLRFQSDRVEIASLGRHLRYAAQPVDFVMSPSDLEDQLMLTVFDQRSRSRLGSLTIPVTHQMVPLSKQVSGGHLVPFGVPGGLVGVSTLQLGDGEPVWRQFPADLTGWRSPVIPGPSGPNFSSFLWRNRLYVVDPLDGALLWQRVIPLSSQEPSQNLALDLIGDRQALAVRSADRTSYEIFETTTGRKISTVRPGFVPGQWQGSFGRYVAGFSDSPEGRRLQVRDLLKEAPEISELVMDASRQPMLLQGGELVYVGSSGSIKIFDVARCETKLSVPSDNAQLSPIGAMRVLSDRSRYFVNLQRLTPTATTAHFHQPINTQVHGMSVRDDFYAFDRASGDLLWKRSLPHRTILQVPDGRLPFLVTLSAVKDRGDNSPQSLLIEVIDSGTGATIGYRENLRIDQLLTAHYDGEAGRILIRGQTSDIELRFGPAEGQSQARR